MAGLRRPSALLVAISALTLGIPWQDALRFVHCKYPSWSAPGTGWLHAQSLTICNAWPSDGMKGIVQRGQPLLLPGDSIGLPSTHWQAHRRWNDTVYLGEALGTIRDIWEHRANHVDHGGDANEESQRGAKAFLYFSHRGGSFGVRAQPTSSAHVVQHASMSGGVFVRSAHNHRHDRAVLYSSVGLSSLGEVARADVQPLADLQLRSPGTSHTTEAVVWLGAGYPTTHAHYDTNTNLFVQVVGQKQITLWPPSSLVDELAVYPSRHSLHRQSPRHSPLEEAPSRAMQVVLEEGDVLYIPPYFAHHVMSLSKLTVSVAMWTDSAECAKKDALSTLPLPWEGEWSFEERTLAATQFIRRVLLDAHEGDPGAARSALRRLLELRYEPLRKLSLVDQEGLLPGASTEIVHDIQGACGEDTTEMRRNLRMQLHAHVGAGARRVADAVRSISTADPRHQQPRAQHSLPPIAEVSLADYIEEVADFVAGSRYGIHAFLSHCVLGGWNRTSVESSGSPLE